MRTTPTLLAVLFALTAAWPASAANNRLPPEVSVPPVEGKAPQGGVELPRLEPGAAPALPTAAAELGRPSIPAGSEVSTPQSAPETVPATPAVAPGQSSPGETPTQESAEGFVASLQALKDKWNPAPDEARDPSGLAQKDRLDAVYFGGRDDRGTKVLAADEDGSVWVVNDEGVQISGRAKFYYKEVRRLVDLYHPHAIDMSESLGVMDDSYSDVWAKLTAVEKVAKDRKLADNNVHLEETLTWVDALIDEPGRKTALHTYSVYFHHAKDPRSEIAEGIRRADKYLDDALEQFRPGGKAELGLGRAKVEPGEDFDPVPLDEVILAFDTRGYPEIKRHIQQREQGLLKRDRKRYRFVYLDELAEVPRDIPTVRAKLNGLIDKYKSQKRGLQKIVEGVIYSRYTGLLLELKTLEHYHRLGYKILQSGRELFGADGHYITELDAVVQAPDGKVTVVEAKSARVHLPLDVALRDKVTYKLETYRKNRVAMEKAIGHPFDVVFAFDVGPNDDLALFLKGKEEELAAEYGFPVSFLFLQSAPQNELARGPRVYQPQRAQDSRQGRQGKVQPQGRKKGKKKLRY